MTKVKDVHVKVHRSGARSANSQVLVGNSLILTEMRKTAKIVPKGARRSMPIVGSSKKMAV